jgi:hypothetical protein
LPALKFGNINEDMFRDFVKKVLPQHTNGMRKEDFRKIFEKFSV